MAARLGECLLRHGYMLATAESCTGGWIAKVLTDIPGSSQWFERGFVTYSDAAKCELLGVREQTIAAHGAVSEATVLEMAAGALVHSRAQTAVAVSGIAGPDGGSPEKPVGTVWLAYAWPGQQPEAECVRFFGDRETVRREAVRRALSHLLTLTGEALSI
jgi:nicotinamide-nucleotide amidase